MAGNVWEWVQDERVQSNYNGAPADGSGWCRSGSCPINSLDPNYVAAPRAGERRIRGGSWIDDRYTIRNAYRGRADAIDQDRSIGGRLAR